MSFYQSEDDFDARNSLLQRQNECYQDFSVPAGTIYEYLSSIKSIKQEWQNVVSNCDKNTGQMLESMECDQWTRVQAHWLQASVMPTSSSSAAATNYQHHPHYITLHYIWVI